MSGRISSLVKAFTSPQNALGGLDTDSVARLVSSASDIALVVDSAGTIRDFALHNAELAADLDGVEDWMGCRLAGLVAADSVPKVEALLRDAATSTEPRWRHVNHRGADGRSVPVLYCAVQAEPALRPGAEGRIVVFGRDLRILSELQQRLMNAQQSLERDYARLRDIETRYRLLFQTTGEAVLILDSGRRRVVEANPAAQHLLGAAPEGGAGAELAALFDADALAAVQEGLSTVHASGAPATLRVRLARDGREVSVNASLFRQEGATLFLLRMVPAERAITVPAPPAADPRAKLLRLVEGAPDGFVVTDNDGRVVTGNKAFLDMAGLMAEEQARGQPLERWVGRSGVDVDVLISNLRERDVVRFFASVVRGEDGTSADVEISAVAVRNGGKPSFGFAIRNVAPRLRLEPRPARELPRSVEQLTELIGRVALKDLVREATDVIERLAIEAALELTSDNRASAAEMLGLSRQSLYVKLRRYGLGEPAADGRN